MAEERKTDKLKMHSPDLTEANIEKLAELFPNCVTEAQDEDGNPKRAIDIDQLRQELSDHVVDGPRERYQLNWPGKREALLAANAPIAKTLRPCREESVDFDTTKNLFIEGDNLDALKLLQETYLNKVRMIYIDPPYNTGSNFVYDDIFYERSDDYLLRSNQSNEYGERLTTNAQTHGRYHSDWLSMMYSRLKLARNILREDGVLFLSIGDEEIANLRNICDELYGRAAFLGCAARVAKKTSNKGTHFAPSKDYVLVYARNPECIAPFMDAVDETYKNKFKETDDRGQFATVGLYQAALDPMRGCSNQRYWVECPDGTFAIPPGDNFPASIEDGSNRPPESRNDRVWRWSYESYLQRKDLVVFKKSKRSPLVQPDGSPSPWNVYTKYYLEDRIGDGTRPRDYLDEFTNDLGTKALKKHGMDEFFDFAKPPELIERIMTWISDDDGIVMDFFAGSGTTAESVMRTNAFQGKSWQYIMVQLPEPIPPETSAARAGYSTVADLSKERIRRAGIKIAEETGLDAEQVDTGFRVLKIDSSNMKDVYYPPGEVTQETLDGLVDNIKGDRSDEDLLFQVLLGWGVDLSLRISSDEIAGKTVYFVDEEALAACFETDIDESFVKQLADRKPLRAVFRDTGYGSDSTKINVQQIFKQYSPNTEVKSI